MTASKSARFTFLKRWLRGSAIVVALAACTMFGTATLKADCGISAKHLMGSTFKPGAFITMAPEEHHESGRAHASFIGLWHVKLVKSDGSLFFQSLVQYHVGGMEMESADISPTVGNFCMGVWKKVAPNTVEIYHVAWIFDSTGTPAGYAIYTQRNVLDNDGDSYSGTFTYTQYDNDGNEITVFSGTTAGRRIDFHHPFKLF